MIKEILKISSNRKDLVQFGLVVGAVFLIFGMIFYWRSKSFWDIPFGIGVFLIISATLFPIILKPIQKVWMSLALCMGWVMTRLILTALFYLILTPIGLIARLSGKDFLDQKIDPKAKSYWKDKINTEQTTQDYERQY